MNFLKFLFPVVVAFIILAIIAVMPASAVAPIGNYIILSGGYVRTSNPSQAVPSSFSLEAWVAPDSVSGQQTILSVGDKSTGKLHYEVGINGGSLIFRYNYGSGSQTVVSAGHLTPEAWNHIGVVLSAQATKLYVNGVQVISVQGASGLLPIGTNIDLGGSFTEGFFNQSGFTGDIDEVRISSTARDMAGLWVSGAYNEPLAVDSNTVLLWHLDEARGFNVAQDDSGNNLAGVLVGGDGKVHFWGVLPTPTPFSFSNGVINWTRPVLPTLSLTFSTLTMPTPNPLPGNNYPSPTTFVFRELPRPATSFHRS
ncbi:LamG domain-containing protein [Patescibacteria group bacterium]|nr:LamG domain-containing protein [Patescibacteria group bacterium]